VVIPVVAEPQDVVSGVDQIQWQLIATKAGRLRNVHTVVVSGVVPMHGSNLSDTAKDLGVSGGLHEDVGGFGVRGLEVARHKGATAMTFAFQSVFTSPVAQPSGSTCIVEVGDQSGVAHRR
jgi:hypothetical protein